MPNNDGDVVFRLVDAGQNAGARKLRAKLQTIRRRTGRAVDGEVHYVWAVDPRPEELEALSRLADGVTHLGLGIDLAAVRVRLTDVKPRGALHSPNKGASNELQIPYPGVLAALEEEYRRERRRIQVTGEGALHVTARRQTEHATCGYAGPASMPRNRCATFRLLRDGHVHYEPPQRAMAVAAMLRHAIAEAAREAGLPSDTLSEVMGHGGEGRIQAVPLPNAGHAYADGGIRRVMIASGPGVAEAVWDSIVRRLSGRPLVPPQAEDDLGVVLVEQPQDSVIRRFTTPAPCWTTATPAVLPGRDHRRGKPRPMRTARRLLRFAGIPDAMVESVTLEPVGRVSGTVPASEAVVPAHLRSYPRAHVTVSFREPVGGPLLLGAGIGWGLGLLIGRERSDAEHQDADVSH